jgi:DNA-binding SARP family transcriptional activator
MLLADESPADPHAVELEVAPTLLSARTLPGAQPGLWQVTCLGRFQLWSGGRLPPSCSSRRGWGVLQYLLVRPGHAATRDALIEAFWPGAEPSAGAHNLQVAVHALRRALRGCGPDGCDETVLFRDGHYCLNPELSIDVDADRFRAACERGRRLAADGQFEPARHAFEEALALYGGPFLGDTRHDDWAEPHRMMLQDLQLSVLGWLSGAYTRTSEWERAAACCRQILALDPYREDAVRQLLHCLAATGRLAELERTYRACRERIWQDLQVEPAPETTRLYHQLIGAAAPRSALTAT